MVIYELLYLLKYANYLSNKANKKTAKIYNLNYYTMAKINIEQLIKDNPVIKIDKEYENTLVSRLNENFTDDEQQLFLLNFYAFMNYDSKKDFVIELGKVWKWLGFTRIDNCKRLLLNDNKFKKGENYIIDTDSNIINNTQKNIRGGNNKETILLTIDCFKHMCLLANTTQSRKIKDYYIKLEDTINTIIQEEYTKLKNDIKQIKQNLDDTKRELEEKTIKIENNKLDVALQNEQDLIIKHDRKRCIYVCKINDDIVKFGITSDIRTRLATHKKEISRDLVLSYVLETVYNVVIENKIKELCLSETDMLYGKRLTYSFNDKIQTELIQLCENFNIVDFWNKIIQIERSINRDEVFLEMEKRIEYLEGQLSLTTEKHENDIRKKEEKIGKLEKTQYVTSIELPIILQNLATGGISTFSVMYKLQKFLNTDINTLKNNIDKQHHMNGYIIRSSNKPYWLPPDNFKFSTIVKRNASMVYVKRVHKITNEVTYYNSITEASLFTQQQIDGLQIDKETRASILLKKSIGELLRGLPTKKEIINTYKWFKMESIGYIVHLDGTRECIDKELEKKDEPESEIDIDEVIEPKELESKEPDISDLNEYNIYHISIVRTPLYVRDVITGQEVIYPQSYQYEMFRDLYKMQRKVLVKKFLNRPIVFKRYTFKTQGNPTWIPPKELYINETEDTNRTNYFLKVIHKDTGKCVYYSSILDMSNNMCNGNFRAIHKKLHGLNPIILRDYDVIKLKSCGSLVHDDGSVEEIEFEMSINDCKDD